jgi:hypothetical protein
LEQRRPTPKPTSVLNVDAAADIKGILGVVSVAAVSGNRVAVGMDAAAVATSKDAATAGAVGTRTRE